MLSHELSLAITNQSNVGLIVLDRDYKVLYWNKFIELYANKSLAEYQNKTIFDVFSELPARWLHRKFSSVIQLKTPAFCGWEQRHHLFEFQHTRPITTSSHYMAQNCKFSLVMDDNQERLLITIEDATDVCHYQSKMQQALDELALANRIDGLTQVFNRKYWEECLAHEYERARRFDHELALIMFDLDHFKRINDKYGHLGGDQVLIDTANTVKKSLRLCDVFGRYGGEEFAVIVPETSFTGACGLAERIRKAIENQIINFNGDNINVTASIGISVLSAADIRYEDLIARADEALYEAKTNGRNRSKYIKDISQVA